MSVEFVMQGKDMADVLEQVYAAMIKHVETEDLAKELRGRLGPQGLEVIIRGVDREPTLEETGITHANPPAPEKRGPGRPRKVVEAAAEPEKTAEKAAEPEKKAAATTNGKADIKTPVTREQVIAALNAYAEANGGQAAGREVMKKVAGVTRLIDCTADDFPKLIEALGG